MRWQLTYKRKVALAVSVCAVLLVPAQIYLYPSSLPNGQFDAAVVLGAATNGAVPSPVFAARLDFAFDLLQAQRVKLVILTGGTASAANLPEGEAGRRYLIARGADPQRLLAEQRSRTTLENLCFAQVIGRSAGVATYVIVSDPLHLRRALRFASDIEMQAVPAATPYTRYQSFWPSLKFLIRESYYYTKRLLLGAKGCP